MSEILTNDQVNDGSQPVGTVIKSTGIADRSAVALVRVEGHTWAYVQPRGTSTPCRRLVGDRYEVLYRPAQPLQVGETVKSKADIERRAEGRRVIVSDDAADIVRWDGFDWESIDGAPHVAPFRVLHIADADAA